MNPYTYNVFVYVKYIHIVEYYVTIFLNAAVMFVDLEGSLRHTVE